MFLNRDGGSTFEVEASEGRMDHNNTRNGVNEWYQTHENPPKYFDTIPLTPLL
jgi:hypothetical protein